MGGILSPFDMLPDITLIWPGFLDFNFNPIYAGLCENLFTLAGGHMAPQPKIALDKGGLNITLKPKKSQSRFSGCVRHIVTLTPQTEFGRDFAECL